MYSAQVCGGGLIFGAFFMATDYVTSPITPNGTDCIRNHAGTFNRYLPSVGCFS
ncbi:MAG: RnfABCDGE type electron transport complex subunit D [Clostridium sp.]